jgi:macrolide-specific efflux system membrane fusion protein
VKTGEIIARMSSTERAALLDAARARGPEALRHWEEVYKATPLISPIDGQVIVSTDQPGQTVTSSEAVMVLSDHLIVQAQVDETDIGAIELGQEARITLDAYPEIKVKGKVGHVYYESELVNNVTIYKVDIIPEAVPAVFRSGMTATVSIIKESKDNVLLLPLDTVKRKKGEAFVDLKKGLGKKGKEQKIELGISDGKNTEVVSGLSEKDTVLVAAKKYVLPSGPKTGSNPFMPSRPKK